MNWSVPSEVTAAAVGAILLWLFQVYDRLRDRTNQRESTIVAISSEVKAICCLIRAKEYFTLFLHEADLIRRGACEGISYIIDIRGNYFKAYDAFLTSLAHLPPKQVSAIVLFYTYCQSAIDSTRPDGPMATCDDLNEKAGAVIDITHLLDAILRLGDQIVQFPKQPLRKDIR